MQFQQKRWPQGVTVVFFLSPKHSTHRSFETDIAASFKSTSCKAKGFDKLCCNLYRVTQVRKASSNKYNNETIPKIWKPLCDISAFSHFLIKMYIIPVSLLEM
jgi:hypothetical protein